MCQFDYKSHSGLVSNGGENRGFGLINALGEATNKLRELRLLRNTEITSYGDETLLHFHVHGNWKRPTLFT